MKVRIFGGGAMMIRVDSSTMLLELSTTKNVILRLRGS